MLVGVRRGSIQIATPRFMPCHYAHGDGNTMERSRLRKASKVGDTLWVALGVLRQDRMTCSCVTMQAHMRISVGGTHARPRPRPRPRPRGGNHQKWGIAWGKSALRNRDLGRPARDMATF